MSQIKSATTAEQLVSETDYVQLSRLVNEHAWRVDNGRADTVHELYMDDGELTLPPGTVCGRDALRAWGRQIVEAPPWHSIRHVCGNMRFVKESWTVARMPIPRAAENRKPVKRRTHDPNQ